MPIYIANKIVLKNAEAVEKAKSILFNEEGEADFNRLIPMPKELEEVEYGSSTALALRVYLNRKRSQLTEKGYRALEWKTKMRIGQAKCFLVKPEDARPATEEEMKAISKDRAEHLRRQGELVARCLSHYGSVSWYDWRCSHWDTKWNAMNSSTSDEWDEGDKRRFKHFVYFETAWTPAIAIAQELAKRLGMKIALLYADESISGSLGVLLINGSEGGAIDQELCPGNNSAEEQELHMEAWGTWGDYRLNPKTGLYESDF